MIKLQGISKFFLNRQNHDLPVLIDINLEVRDGEFFCVIGPSGCGKTTLLNLIAGFENPSSGKALCDGVEIKGTSPSRLVVFQELGLFPWLNVQSNIEFGLKIGRIRRSERQAIVSEYLKKIRLSKFKDYYLHELSGGMKQRVALARAFALDPEVLLMDEPFAALDAQNRDMLHEELQNIWSGTHKTIVFVTHNIREAVCLGDRIILLSAQPGRIKAEYCINLPRPRHIEDPGLMDVVRPILGELKVEIQKTSQETARQ